MQFCVYVLFVVCTQHSSEISDNNNKNWAPTTIAKKIDNSKNIVINGWSTDKKSQYFNLNECAYMEIIELYMIDTLLLY